MALHQLTLAGVVGFASSFGTMPHHSSPPSASPVNPCEGAKPKDAQFTDANGVLDPTRTIKGYFDNTGCAEMMDTGFGIDLPQSGMDVTADGEFGDLDYKGTFDPILENYDETDLCMVNVHWHLGTEHRSEGEYDEQGSGPHAYLLHGKDIPGWADNLDQRRQLAGKTPLSQQWDDHGKSGFDDRDGGLDHAFLGHVRQGMLCHHYTESDPKFTTPYAWEHCEHMEVGQTYEIHWPHSAAGACGTKWQVQHPFYDGVFCKAGVISLGDEPPFNVNKKIGVQGQVFTVVNSDEPEYQYDDLFSHAWMDDSHWVDVAKYVGSTTGTSRDNELCSMYTPITWQVDRKCHMVSAKSWDKMCKMMKDVPDDMYEDLHPHGSRELVDDEWSSAHVHRKQRKQ